jgi:predicted GTPase
MVIRSEYDELFKHVSAIERNFIVHGSAGIGKSSSFQALLLNVTNYS